MIAVHHKRTLLTNVGSDTQTLGGQFATVATALRGVSGINPADFTTSTFSLVLKNLQECRPTRVHDALAQSPILDHTLDVQVFHHNQGVQQRVPMRHLEVKVAPLAFNLQMRLRHPASRLLAAIAALCTTTPGSLFAPQGPLRRTKKARGFKFPSLSVRKDFKPTSIPTAGRSSGVGEVETSGSSHTIRAYQWWSARLTTYTVFGVPSTGRWSLILMRGPSFFGTTRCRPSTRTSFPCPYCRNWKECHWFGNLKRGKPTRGLPSACRSVRWFRKNFNAFASRSETVCNVVAGVYSPAVPANAWSRSYLLGNVCWCSYCCFACSSIALYACRVSIKHCCKRYCWFFVGYSRYSNVRMCDIICHPTSSRRIVPHSPAA
jgi:hypothetical protein